MFMGITSRKKVRVRKGPPKATPRRKDASVTLRVYSHYADGCNKAAAYQSGRSLWKRMRMGRNSSGCQPCSGHSSLRGKFLAPGTGFSTSAAPHFPQGGKPFDFSANFSRKL
jgi:hypothetical protein